MLYRQGVVAGIELPRGTIACDCRAIGGVLYRARWEDTAVVAAVRVAAGGRWCAAAGFATATATATKEVVAIARCRGRSGCRMIGSVDGGRSVGGWSVEPGVCDATGPCGSRSPPRDQLPLARRPGLEGAGRGEHSVTAAMQRTRAWNVVRAAVRLKLQQEADGVAPEAAEDAFPSALGLEEPLNGGAHRGVAARCRCCACGGARLWRGLTTRVRRLRTAGAHRESIDGASPERGSGGGLQPALAQSSREQRLLAAQASQRRLAAQQSRRTSVGGRMSPRPSCVSPTCTWRYRMAWRTHGTTLAHGVTLPRACRPPMVGPTNHPSGSSTPHPGEHMCSTAGTRGGWGWPGVAPACT
jgi:hypothetical protein